jgi:glycosyltransferase involved in cell wall biosynthesis
MIEAMATGTPVVALRRGSVPEVVVDGETGIICDNFCDMVNAISRIGNLDRRSCRQRVERYFSTQVMAARYERTYGALLNSETRSRTGQQRLDGPDPEILEEPWMDLQPSARS